MQLANLLRYWSMGVIGQFDGIFNAGLRSEKVAALKVKGVGTFYNHLLELLSVIFFLVRST